ncbi:FHA domain-containing protein [Lentzea albida]|uniref:FHA domain-containing protein n=2 Tax=Lentzea albida TaxID=65499 RepID=A0A1H9TLC1_9PSEU|nr:FHA domain-containing protein [Lentzea albida]
MSLPDSDKTRFVVLCVHPADMALVGRDLIDDERSLNVQVLELGGAAVRIREYREDSGVLLGRARVTIAGQDGPKPVTHLLEPGEPARVGPRQQARLVSIDAPGQCFSLPAGGGVIGRDADECEIVLDLPTVSRRHVRIAPRLGGFTVEDLNSANGMTINSRTTELGVLVHGDILGLGRKVRLRLELHGNA